MGMLVFAMSGQILPALLAPVAGHFDRDLSERGLLLAFGPAGFVLSTVLSGWLSDRWGRRVFILLGLAAMAVGLGLAGAARTVAALTAGLLLLGVSGGLIEAPISLVVSDVFVERRAQALNAVQLFFNIGAVGGPILVSLLLWAGAAWRAGFGAAAFFAAAAWALSFRFLPRHGNRARTPVRPDGERNGGRGLVIALSVALFLYVGGEMTVAAWSANYLSLEFGVPDARAELAVSGFWLGMMIGRALYVGMVERMGYLPLVMGSAVLSAVTAVAAAFARTSVAASVLCGLVGLFLGGSWPTILSYAAGRCPQRTGAVFGVIVGAGAMGMLTVPPLAGWVAERSSLGLRAAMLLAAASVIAEGLVLFAIWRCDRRRRKAARAAQERT